MSDSPRHGVPFGACWNAKTGSDFFCSVDANSCPRTMTYVSASYLKTASGVPPSSTDCKAADVKSGTCRSNKVCSNNSRSCGITTGFREDPKCNLEMNTEENTATAYGGCQDNSSGEITCVWDKTDCTTTETFKSVLELLDMGKPCYCDQVRTGLCIEPDGDMNCAAQATSCGAVSDFVKARHLMRDATIYNNMDCRLCDDLSFDVVTRSENVHIGSSSSSSSNKAGVIVGVIIGVLAVVVICAVAFVVYRRKQASAQTTLKEANIDVTTDSASTEPEKKTADVPTPPEIT